MSVRENVTPFGVDNKAGGLAGARRVGIEGAGLAEANRDNVTDDALDRGLPLRSVAWQETKLIVGHVFDLVDAVVL